MDNKPLKVFSSYKLEDDINNNWVETLPRDLRRGEIESVFMFDNDVQNTQFRDRMRQLNSLKNLFWKS